MCGDIYTSWIYKFINASHALSTCERDSRSIHQINPSRNNILIQYIENVYHVHIPHLIFSEEINLGLWIEHQLHSSWAPTKKPKEPPDQIIATHKVSFSQAKIFEYLVLSYLF